MSVHLEQESKVTAAGLTCSIFLQSGWICILIDTLIKSEIYSNYVQVQISLLSFQFLHTFST